MFNVPPVNDENVTLPKSASWVMVAVPEPIFNPPKYSPLPPKLMLVDPKSSNVPKPLMTFFLAFSPEISDVCRMPKIAPSAISTTPPYVSSKFKESSVRLPVKYAVAVDASVLFKVKFAMLSLPLNPLKFAVTF
ncbi:unknown [Acetobacter sp. CAG:977]|nr:unknown [Acetobacter sp. CAG:977]